MSHFSKQVGFVLETSCLEEKSNGYSLENNIFWWRKNKSWRFNLMMEGTFSWIINNCFFIRSDLASS